MALNSLVVGLFGLALLGLSAEAAVQIEVLSRPYTNVAHVFGDSSGIQLSGDGAWAAFSSNGNGLAPNDANGLKLDVFLKDLRAGDTVLVSRTASGGSANGDSVLNGISSDGRFVVFESDASDLAEGDDNDANDVFLYERDTGKIVALSRTATGFGDAASASAQITRNGQFVLFSSEAANLAENDSNDGRDYFLFSVQSGELKLVTVNSNNTGSASLAFDGPSPEASVSENGRFVAFISGGTNLVAQRLPANSGYQLYLRDMEAGTNVWVSHDESNRALQNVFRPVLSANGQVLAFISSGLSPGISAQQLYLYRVASNSLVQVPVPNTRSTGVDAFALSANGQVAALVFNGNIYRYDIETGNLRQITASEGDSTVPGANGEPVISDDGTMIIFTSAQRNLGLVETHDAYQLYRYSSIEDKVAPLSLSVGQPDGATHDILFPTLSADGTTAGFTSYANNLSSEDDKLVNDVFVVGTSGTNDVQLVSVAHPTAVSATANGGSSFQPNGLSADGRWAVFSSNASDLTPGDEDNETDVFLRDLETGANRLVSSSDSAAVFLGKSRDARFVAYTAGASNGTARTIYLFDTADGTNQVAAILPNGAAAASSEAFLSDDGKVLAFRATSVGAQGIYVRDLVEGKTYIVTNSALSAQQFAGLSPSGRYVALYPSSGALRLVDWRSGSSVTLPAGGGFNPVQFTTDESTVLFTSSAPLVRPGLLLSVYSLVNGTTNMVATNIHFAAISGNGSTIAAVHATTNNSMTIVIHDLAAGTSATIAQTEQAPLFRARSAPVLSHDGRFIVFSTQNALLGEDTGFSNVYLYDRADSSLTLVSRTPSGAPGNLASGDPAISDDGQTIVFQSNASDLVPNDRNLGSDVFVAHIVSAESGFAVQIAAQTPGSVRLSIHGVAGKTGQLQHRASLGSGEWQDIGAPMTATGDTLEWTQNAAENSGFYRVRLLP